MAVLSATASTRYRIENVQADDKHDLVEEEVVIPHLDSSSQNYVIEYKSGTIEEVHLLSGTEPAILRVKTEDEDYIDLNYALEEQEQPVEG